MHQLIYLSAASNLLTNKELVDILTKSRLNNTNLNVTGLLLYHEGSILQILEGEKEVITKLFTGIKNDHRHTSVIKVIEGSIPERNFKDWSMGFKQISKENWSELGGYLNLDNKEAFYQFASSRSDLIITLIKSFANVNML